MVAQRGPIHMKNLKLDSEKNVFLSSSNYCAARQFVDSIPSVFACVRTYSSVHTSVEKAGNVRESTASMQSSTFDLWVK